MTMKFTGDWLVILTWEDFDEPDLSDLGVDRNSGIEGRGHFGSRPRFMEVPLNQKRADCRACDDI